jgi:hypothetical protein
MGVVRPNETRGFDPACYPATHAPNRCVGYDHHDFKRDMAKYGGLKQG